MSSETSLTSASVSAIAEIEDAHVLRDQAAERIERELADGSFDAALAQFFDDADAELSTEAAIRQIPAR